MKNTLRGFIIPLMLTIIGLIIICGGTYIYFNKIQQSKQDNLSITDPADVTNYDTCMSYAKNITTSFDIVFGHGSDIQGVTNFSADFQTAYPRSELKVSTEQDFVNQAVAYNGGGIKTQSGLTAYESSVAAQATSKVSVKIPINDLGSEQNFNNFMSATLKKYPDITFVQYAGLSPEDSLSNSEPEAIQKSAEAQCNYKYKTLNTSERASLDTNLVDQKIEISVSASRVGALHYYEDNDSYAQGSLSLNNGVCSATGVHGLKDVVDSIAQAAGSVSCYASSNEYALSAPLKSNPSIGYCADSNGFYGTTSSPTAASKGYCLTPPKSISQNISSCQGGANARLRWICVGSIVDPSVPSHIGTVIAPFATPVSQKISFCKTLSGVEADYCFSSIVKDDETGDPQVNDSICAMVSNQNPWFKNDCESND
jgi:hypothetical protein